jgi:hypothetical protein
MIKRNLYLDKISPYINKDIVKVLIGIRRSGKTVVLSQIKEMLTAREIPDSNIIYINFESMKYSSLKTADALYEYIDGKINSIQGKTYIMLDEIQEVQDWQRAVNSFRVDYDCDIYITGSNSKLLSGELATYLAGRYIKFLILPFTLSEIKAIRIENNTYKNDNELFADYLKYGGMPQRFSMPTPDSTETYLRDVSESVILKDIITRHSIKDIGILKNLIYFMLDNIGNPFSIRKISGMLTSMGHKVSTATISSYLDYLQEAYLIFSVSRYDIKGKNLLSSTEKYYAIDPGLRNINKKSEQLDSSKLYENAVYLKMLSKGYEIQVGKLNDNEIDFICYKGTEKIYIQVAYLINEHDIKREFGNLEKIPDNYPKWVISGDIADLSHNGIKHLNIIDFLLS